MHDDLDVQMMEKKDPEPFTKWRRRLWPVHLYECYKLIPLLLLKFFVSLNYHILHSTKDTLVVTTSGAEVIPILKGGFVLVMAFLVMLAYSKLSNILSRTGLFYCSMAPFIIFFAIYGFFLYPNREWLSPHDSANWLVSVLGDERAHWVAVYRYWMDSLFFLMAELWGQVVIALLFWSFANQISTVYEASRFYPLFSAGGHIGVIASGPIIWYYSQTFSEHHFSSTVEYLMGIVTLIGLSIVCLYWWINKYVVKPHPTANAKTKDENEETPKLSLWESLKYIVHSPYLGCIALMVIGYSLSVNMVEVTWKGILKLQYPNPQDYQGFMGIVTTLTGIVALILSIFAGGNLIRKFGWYFSAQLTPIVLGISSLFFYFFYFTDTLLGSSIAVFGGGALMLVVICGAIHNIACKSMKYCLFDPTKEMAYIPLDVEAKIKGKAAVDVVASRFGKSGSSWIQAGMMEIVGVSSVLSIVPYLTPFVLLAVIGWMVAVYYLKGHYSRVGTQETQLAKE